MSNKLWTLHFTRICIANLLLYISLYVLLPVIPTMMAARLQMPIQQTGSLFLLLTLGMVLAGPFYAYLVDAYKRKQVCLFSFLGIIAATLGYNYVDNLWQLWLLVLGQGVCFGMATTAAITLGIDINTSMYRSAGNVAFAWMSRIGMMTGIALGVWLTPYYSFQTMLYVSTGIGVMGIGIVSLIHVPFRAPIGTQLCSCDRFFLPRAWLPALNLALVAFVPGALLPILTHSFDTILLHYYTVPYFAVVLVGFLLSFIADKMLFLEDNQWKNKIVTGLVCMIFSLALLLVWGEGAGVASALLLGFAIGLVTPEFLMMFIKLSHHCQRGTANTTHLLAWELGISGGIAMACWLNVSYEEEVVIQVALFAGLVAMAFFLWGTVPYFIRKRVR